MARPKEAPLIKEEKHLKVMKEVDSTTYIISGNKQSKHLSDVFNYLPAGLVLKEETGMGATHLESLANHDSIIVEPSKITASSKAKKHNGLYVGSGTKYHPGKVLTPKRIKEYLDDPTKSPKKIYVTTDSLPRVIEAIGDNVYKDYFLLLDEIDSLQLESTFRPSMEVCIDEYKKFDKNKRCMLSATGIEFNDPELKQEEKSIIKYSQPNKRDITILQDDNLHGACVDIVQNIFRNNPNAKIVVAYNHVNGCIDIAQQIKANTSIEDIGLLCSQLRDKEVADYFTEMSSSFLPCHLTFCTSAYFTGFDIEEDYHLISISDPTNRIFMLSEGRLKQIAGRCRRTLLSETVLYNVTEKTDSRTIEDLLNAANQEKLAIKCMKKHYEKSPVLQKNIEKLMDDIIGVHNSNNISYIRQSDGKPEVSYLNIDAELEYIRSINNLYVDEKSLEENLIQAGNNAIKNKSSSKTIVIRQNNSLIEKRYKIDQLITELRTAEFEDVLHMKDTNQYSLLERRIIDQVMDKWQYLDKEDFLDKILSAARMADSRVLNRLFASADFLVSDQTDVHVARFKHYFPISAELTVQEIDKRVKLYQQELPLGFFSDLNAADVEFLNTFAKAKRNSRKGTYKILNYNPLFLIVKNHKKSIHYLQ